MKCPYCTSAIDDEALACPHCTRDLYLLKPLLGKIDQLEQRVKGLEAQLAAAPSADAAVPLEEDDRTPRQPVRDFLALWATPLLLLLVAHFLLVIVIDAHTLWLRIFSLLIPLPFGIALMNRRWRPLPPWSLAAFAMAGCAVLGMSGLTSLVDHTAVLPQDRREWREFAEYAASVGFSFITGMLLGRLSWRRRQHALRVEKVHGALLKLAELLTAGQEGADKIQATVKKMKDAGNSLAAAATTAAAAYTGMQSFWGH